MKFVVLTGYPRTHAVRVLNGTAARLRARRSGERRKSRRERNCHGSPGRSVRACAPLRPMGPGAHTQHTWSTCGTTSSAPQVAVTRGCLQATSGPPPTAGHGDQDSRPRALAGRHGRGSTSHSTAIVGESGAGRAPSVHPQISSASAVLTDLGERALPEVLARRCAPPTSIHGSWLLLILTHLRPFFGVSFDVAGGQFFRVA